jgi:LPXTG-motif cell wall-anchored protein
MKLRNKVVAGFAATVLALSMMVGTALASTKDLPFEYPNEANAATNNDVWVKLVGGGAGEQVSTQEVADVTKSVDVTITGKCSFDAELIFNFDGGWVPTAMKGQTVDGELVLNMPFVGKGATYAEVIVNLQNKTEGPLAVTKLEWKDEAGNVVFTWPVADEAAAADVATDDAAATDAAATDAAAPKTGVESFGLIFGLGAAVLGSGAVVLKRREK